MQIDNIILDKKETIPTEFRDSSYENEIVNYNFKNYLISKTYNFIEYKCEYILKTVKIIINISGIYLLWVVLHYVASHLYIKFCVPGTFIGFIISPFMTATPHCQGLRWLIYNAANIINNMWIMSGAWLCSTLLIINHDKKEYTT